MYNIGDWVYDLVKIEKVQVIEKTEVWGFVSYKVFNPTNNLVYKLSREQIGDCKEIEKYDENYVRYITLLAKIKNETAEGFLANIKSGVMPLPHQLHVLNRAVSNNNIRYILADEVGLGKTIEAGLIIKELKARGLIKGILIVCPKGLVTQWSIEMKEKFGEKFNIILPVDFDTIKKITNSDDIYGQFNQVITSMDSIKPIEKRTGWTSERIEQYNEDRIYGVVNSGWDLIVVDEAHRVAGSSGDVARYKLGNMLSKSSPYLLLLTATPHSGKTEPFLRLIRLLDEKAFPNYKAIVKEQVAPYVIRTEKREAIDSEGNKLFKNRITKVIEIKWDERHSMQKKLYEIVSNYVRNGYNKALKEKKNYIGFLMVLMQRLVTSSTAAIKESIEKRIDILENQETKINNLSFEDLVEVDMEENLDKAMEIISLNIRQELEELRNILDVAKQAQFQYLDAKVDKLIEILDELDAEDKNMKVIIFTEFVSTQNFLRGYLISKGYKISILNGSMDIDERNIVLNEFKTNTDILVSTDAGGEGLNLQFSNVVINYDLPWNPMKVEQRIGRVDRIGQQRDVIVFNFIIEDTVENRVRKVLEDKLNVILKETGIDKMSDVLDNEFSELDFTDVYMKSIRTPKNIDYNVNKIEEDIKTQIENSTKYKELIKEEKELTIEKYYSTNINIDLFLRRMLEYYRSWKEEPILPIKNLSITDSEIVKHLNKNLPNAFEGILPCIRIEDFPNEKGYFSLWELTINDDRQSTKIIPVFINSDMIIRPLSGKKIWEVLLKEDTKIHVIDNISIEEKSMQNIIEISQQFAYDMFLKMKNDYEKRNDENYRKYLYAINLRIEAAFKIGIENIRLSRLKALNKEKEKINLDYETRKSICPIFKPIFMSYLER